jgi:hypothetical protein
MIRHGLTVLWPSEIAQQDYCEYKVHLARLHPEVEIHLGALEAGTASHTDLVSDAQPVTDAEIAEAIKGGKQLAICEWMLEGVFHGVTVRGRPDFLALKGKKAHLVLDFKFSRARDPFRDQRAQAQTYALLAEANAL